MSIAEAGIRSIRPRADNVLIIKDEEDGVSPGGIVIPEAHRGYNRRGWVLAVGGGFSLNGVVVPMPYEPGDYLIADRSFVRRDESEEELYHNPTIMLVRGDEPLAYIRRQDCKGKRCLPERFEGILRQFGFKPGWTGRES
jgi:co-chaperonin GroES (HSP10)